MPKQKLIATRSMQYGTRRLEAGDPFEVKNKVEATIWTQVRKTARPDYDAPVKEALAAPVAAPVFVPAQSPPSSPPVSAPPVFVHEETHHEPDPLDALRGEAAALGVHVDRRWGEARLAQEIDAALEIINIGYAENEPRYRYNFRVGQHVVTGTVLAKPGDDDPWSLVYLALHELFGQGR